jgi:hypothetical protein
VRDEESGICVAYVEEGLLNFGFSMMQLLISSLPLPAQVNGGLELRFGRSAGEPVYSKDQRILRLFEIACQYLLGSASGRLQPFPLQPIQYAAAAPLWDCIEAFVVGHEFSHALHADLSAAAPTLTEPDVEGEAALAIASVMADPIQQHAAMPHLLDLLRELQADFRAVDLMLGTRAHSTGAVMALTAPLVFLECLEILEELLFRLAYGRDATGPGFTGHPSPRMRKAYLLSRLQKYADTELLTEVSSLFKDIQQVLADIWPMVAEQMHILGRHEVEPNTKWRRMVRSMAPIEEGS